MHFLDVGMVFRLGQDAGDDSPLFRDPQALFGAERLKIDLTHEGNVGISMVDGKREWFAPPAGPIDQRDLRRRVPRPIFLARVRRCSA